MRAKKRSEGWIERVVLLSLLVLTIISLIVAVANAFPSLTPHPDNALTIEWERDGVEDGSVAHNHYDTHDFQGSQGTTDNGGGNPGPEPYSAFAVWDNRTLRLDDATTFDSGHGYINEGNDADVPTYKFAAGAWPANATETIKNAFNMWGAINSARGDRTTGVRFREVAAGEDVTVKWEDLTAGTLGVTSGFEAGKLTIIFKNNIGISLVNFAANERHDGANGVYDPGESIYTDNNADSTVSVGDKRLTSAGPYNADTTVSAGDLDIGTGLNNFAAAEKHTERMAANNLFDPGEKVYLDNDANNQVSVGDTRLMGVWQSYLSTSNVAAGDRDITNDLAAFNGIEKHTEVGAANATFEYTESIYRDNDANSLVSIGDTRTVSGGVYAGDTTVAAGQSDIGTALVNFAANEKHDDFAPANGIYQKGEFIYRDVDASNKVSAGDVRLTTGGGSYGAGSVVAAGDGDLNGGWFFGNQAGTPATDYHFLTVALHEIGHALGLDHQNDTDDLMYWLKSVGPNNPQLNQGPSFDSIDADSIDGVRDLYSIPTATGADEYPYIVTGFLALFWGAFILVKTRGKKSVFI